MTVETMLKVTNLPIYHLQDDDKAVRGPKGSNLLTFHGFIEIGRPRWIMIPEEEDQFLMLTLSHGCFPNDHTPCCKLSDMPSQVSDLFALFPPRPVRLIGL